MAAPHRNRTKPDDPLFKRTRDKIQISQLLNRLENNALGNLKTPKGDPIEMSSGQIKSAEILLNKAIPNLQATSHTGSDGEGPMEIHITRTIIDPKKK